MKTKESIRMDMLHAVDQGGEYFSLIRSKPSKKAIHYWRVQMKHLKSYIRFFDYMADGKGTIIMNEDYKELYTHAGTYRNLQIGEKYFTSYKLFIDSCYEDLVQRIHKKKKKEKKAFRKQLEIVDPDTKNLHNQINTFFRRHTKGSLVEGWQGYKESMVHKVKKIQKQKHVKCKKLHKMRKHTKDLLYLHKLFGISEEFYQELVGWTQLLGRWNDRYEMIGLLYEFLDDRKKKLKKKQKKHIQKLIGKLQKINDKQKKILLKTHLQTFDAPV